ncbi:MAG TPA: hypothetical protein VMC41_00715 [Candidatus Nanoarchaeia archaeon]|nr:hypothetical protein [Candidatus Nanoarchaeia archaeon]
MKNVKLSTRLLAMLVILLGIGGLFLWQNKLLGPMKNVGEIFNSPAKTSGGNISIVANKQGLIPFDVLLIDGKNFDPAAAASVIFTTGDGESLTVPTLSVTPTQIAVTVPPLGYNKKTGMFNYQVASYKVVQMKKDGTKLSVRTSNEISGILIGAPIRPNILKRVDAKDMPVGTITRAFVAIAAQSLQDAAEQTPASSTEVKASLIKQERGMEDLLAGLDKFIKNPKTSIKVPATSGGVMNLDAAGVAWIDAFYSGFLGFAEEKQAVADAGDNFSLIPAARAAETGCQANAQQGQTAAAAVGAEVNCLYANAAADHAKAVDNRSLYDRLDFKNNMWIIDGTILLAMLTGGMSVEVQIAAAIIFSLTASYLHDGKLPDVDDLPGAWATVLGGYIDEIVGVPICDYLSTSLDIYKEKCANMPTEFCKKITAIVSWPGKMLMYFEYGPGGKEGDALTMPDNNLVRVLDNIGSKEGGYELIKQGLAPLPGPGPIKVIPSPGPGPKPPPPPPGPSCEQKKEAAYAKCAAGCGNQQDCYTAYDECTPGCGSVHDLLAKSDCINACLGALSKCTGASAKCSTDCLNARSATVCP